VPAELNPRIRDRDLARIRHRIASGGPGEQAWLGPVGPLPTPGTIDQYVTAGVPTLTAVAVLGPDAEYYPMPATYRRGQSVVRRWNAGVVGPAFPGHPFFAPYLVRVGDELHADLPLFSDRADHVGLSRTDSARLTLSRDGVVLGESPELGGSFAVPAGAGTYRLEAAATRSISAFSTRVTAAWTFRSATAAEAVVPLTTVRFTPRLDDHNLAPAGQAFTFPVQVAARARLAVDVSYDDGVTWQAATVTGSGPRRAVTVRHPADASFVALRATAVEDGGDAVTESITRAYGLRR
jgi:hypothetical protein